MYARTSLKWLVLAMVPRAAAASERIMEGLQTTSEITDPAQPQTPQQPTGRVTFDAVRFG